MVVQERGRRARPAPHVEDSGLTDGAHQARERREHGEVDRLVVEVVVEAGRVLGSGGVVPGPGRFEVAH